jgi:hypothetical protein
MIQDGRLGIYNKGGSIQRIYLEVKEGVKRQRD